MVLLWRSFQARMGGQNSSKLEYRLFIPLSNRYSFIQPDLLSAYYVLDTVDSLRDKAWTRPRFNEAYILVEK